jgi:hypothetical protein
MFSGASAYHFRASVAFGAHGCVAFACMHIETYECEEADGESDCASVTFILNPSDAVRRYETRKFQVEV